MNDVLKKLTELFYPSQSVLGHFTPIHAAELSDQYQSLLDHQDHMTVTVEAWHNSLVEVRVLDDHRESKHYARKIVLARQRDAVVVLFGIMRINLAGLPDIVRLEIESQALPLGRIMIRHHLLREVELCQLWQIVPGKELRFHMQLTSDEPIFGRTARILIEDQPVVELLEIVSG